MDELPRAEGQHKCWEELNYSNSPAPKRDLSHGTAGWGTGNYWEKAQWEWKEDKKHLE